MTVVGRQLLKGGFQKGNEYKEETAEEGEEPDHVGDGQMH